MLNPSTLDLQESAQPSPVSPNERPATQPALHVQPPNLAEPPNLPSLLGGAGRENEKRPAGRVRPNFETPQGSEESGSPSMKGGGTVAAWWLGQTLTHRFLGEQGLEGSGFHTWTSENHLVFLNLLGWLSVSGDASVDPLVRRLRLRPSTWPRWSDVVGRSMC